jgi:hypothetical protein
VRRLALCFVALVMVVPATVLAASKPPAGALSVEGGRGVIVVRASGGLLGRVSHGTVELVDLSSGDSWRPTLNGVTKGRRATAKGYNLTFRILGGDYRLVVRGEGISISARGVGVATLLGTPSVLTGDAGIFSTNLEADCQDAPDQCDPIPMTLTRVPFGKPDTPTNQHP